MTTKPTRPSRLPTSWQDINVFAHSIGNGFELAGGMDRCGWIAEIVTRFYQRGGPKTLAWMETNELRFALFMYARAVRHGGLDPDEKSLTMYRAIVRELAKRNGERWVWDQVEQGRQR